MPSLRGNRETHREFGRAGVVHPDGPQDGDVVGNMRKQTVDAGHQRLHGPQPGHPPCQCHLLAQRHVRGDVHGDLVEHSGHWLGQAVVPPVVLHCRHRGRIEPLRHEDGFGHWVTAWRALPNRLRCRRASKTAATSHA